MNFQKAGRVYILLAGRAGFITGGRLPELIGAHGFRSEAEDTEKARAGPVRTRRYASGKYRIEA